MMRRIAPVLPVFFVIIFVATSLSGCGGSRSAREFVPPVYPAPPEKPRFVYERTFRSSLDVKEITGMDRFKQAVTGTMSSGRGIAKPYGIAVYQGRVYVTDTVSRAILMFDVPGKDFKAIGVEGPGTITKPIGITVSNQGELYVADHTSKRIMESGRASCRERG